jgi:ABC-type sugar transport system permease subunit
LLRVAPLFALLLLSFGLPIAVLLARAVYDPTMHDALPTPRQRSMRRRARVCLTTPYSRPREYLRAAKQNDSLYNLAKDLNNLLPAARSHVLRTARGLSPDKRLTRAELIALEPFWAEGETWSAIRSGVRPFTTNYLLAAIDLRWTADGGIARVLPDQAIYGTIFVRTFAIAAGVTLITLVLGFPLAWLLANLSGPTATRLILLVLPFWTSILVRTAWTLLRGSGIRTAAAQDYRYRTSADLMYCTPADHRHDASGFRSRSHRSTASCARSRHQEDAGSVFPGGTRLPHSVVYLQVMRDYGRLPADLHSVSWLLHHSGW